MDVPNTPLRGPMLDVGVDTGSGGVISEGISEKDKMVMTEPDLLGPCDPGTSVQLQGIVWQETENGRS